MENLILKIKALKRELDETKAKLEEEITKTDLYETVFSQTLSGDYEISEKDAKKHALNVCMKNLKK